MLQKHYKQKQVTNANYANNLTRQKTTLSARPIMAKEQHIKRYDTVCAQQHFNICRDIKVKLAVTTGMSMYQNEQKQVEKAK